MGSIPITPEVNYKVELDGGEYYPALLDIVEFDDEGKPYIKKEGWTELFFYLPNKRNKLLLTSRSLDINHLAHLEFPDLKDETPKIFIHKGLAELLGDCDFSRISPSKIKNASEVKDYQKYFDIFQPKDYQPSDFFSQFAGTPLFPDK